MIKNNILYQIYPTLSFNIRERRKELGLTQKELAKKAGVSFRTIQNYENRLTPPSPHIIEKIAIALDTPIETLISHYKFDNNISASQILEKISQDKEYKSKIDNLNLTDIIFDMVDLEMKYKHKTLEEATLDKSLGGRNNIDYRKKYYLVKLMLEQKLQSTIDELKNEMIENYLELLEIYRFKDKDTGNFIDKEKY
ncbi:helix-turn-helix domain-containing protein [Gemella morbillorum]